MHQNVRTLWAASHSRFAIKLLDFEIIYNGRTISRCSFFRLPNTLKIKTALL